MIRLIDTHAHLLSEKYDNDREELLNELSFSMEAVIENASSVRDFTGVMDLVNRYPFIYGAIGVHPEEMDGYDEDTLSLIREMQKDKRIVAIGEIGLDYYWVSDNKELQEKVFRDQLELAMELDKPVVIHDREATEDIIKILRDYSGLKGEMHCFVGDRDEASFVLDKGMYLGYGGILTFKNPGNMEDTLRYAPLDRILLETDSPYLSPVPVRGKRNRPDHVLYIAKRMAEIKGLDTEEMIEILNSNARTLYGLQQEA